MQSNYFPNVQQKTSNNNLVGIYGCLSEVARDSSNSSQRSVYGVGTPPGLTLLPTAAMKISNTQ